MKLLVINPNSDTETVRILKEKLDQIKIAGVDTDCIALTTTPKLINGPEDCKLASAEMVQLIGEREQQYDAFIIACFSDPNLEFIRKITDKPVFGIAESAMKLAAFYGNKFLIISPTKKAAEGKYLLAEKYHVSERLSKVLVANGESEQDILETATQGLAEYDSDVILLGCANYSLMDKNIEKSLKVPVLDGLACAYYFSLTFLRYNCWKTGNEEAELQKIQDQKGGTCLCHQ